LEPKGITVNIIPSTGGAQNLALLRDPKSGVQAGFVISGIGEETDAEDLQSLGTVSYQPMWFFTRELNADKGLLALRGKRICIGLEGSDSRALFSQLLKRNKLDLKAFKLVDLAPADAAKALLAGKLDALVLVDSFASPVVRQLASADGVRMASFSRADAYVAIFPSLSKLVLPAGAANLSKDRPNRDTVLLSPKTSLIVREDMHPALQYLLLEIASKAHSRRGVFNKAGEFPGTDVLEIPLSKNALHYYKSGTPFLQRFLPFWLAVLLEQVVSFWSPSLD